MWFRKDKRTTEEKTLEYLKKHERDFIRAILYIPGDSLARLVTIFLVPLWAFLTLVVVAIWA
jgi:hypothetical protein